MIVEWVIYGVVTTLAATVIVFLFVRSRDQ